MRKNMREIKRKEGGGAGKGKREGKERNGKEREQEGTQGAIMKDWGVEWLWGFEEMKG